MFFLMEMCLLNEVLSNKKGDSSSRRNVGIQDDGNKKAGFTLVEVLFAVGVMTVFLVGMTAVLIKSLSSTEVAENRSQAAVYLQEGIEYARQCRDQADSWEDFIEISFAEVTEGIFTRTIDNTSCSITNDKCQIVVTVNWTDSKGSHEITANTILSNWK